MDLLYPESAVVVEKQAGHQLRRDGGGHGRGRADARHNKDSGHPAVPGARNRRPRQLRERPGVGATLSATKFSFLAIGGAGVDFILGPILLGAEARYMYVSEQTFDWGSMKLSGVNITANVGYVF